MPLFSRKETSPVDYKARLEHKLYLARENPEPVFDISDCALKVIPSGLFSLCRVFRKEALYLQDNQLSSFKGGGSLRDLTLLQVLDIHSNCFTSLPADIQHLKNLRVLNVHSNAIKQLPDSIGCLDNLRVFNASSNNLRTVPSSLGELKCLQRLDLRQNKHLVSLPSSLYKAASLKELLVDASGFQYPPEDVVEQGTESIMKFFCQECGVEYVAPCESPVETSSASRSTDLSGHDDRDQAFQEEKQQERLALEKDLGQQYQRELNLQNAMRDTKGRLLENIAEQQTKLENEILRIQHGKEAERRNLIKHLHEVERIADGVISQLLATGGSTQNSAQLQHLLDQERRQEEQLLDVKQEEYKSLRHKDVLHAMETLLEEEGHREKKLREYEEGRAITTRTLLSQEVESDKQLVDLLTNQGKAQTELIRRLQKDEELQRAAVGALLEKSDARSCGLVHQVALVQSQLAALTAVELERRKLEMTEQLNELCDKRLALSCLLVELLSQQTERRKQLLGTLQQMEKQRWMIDQADAEISSDYWLMQYQRLLDSRPADLMEMEKSLDPLLAQHLVLAGAIHCLPFLGKWISSTEELSQLRDKHLFEAGVSLAQDRVAVLEAVRQYIEELTRTTTRREEPTAPLATPTEPTAPSDTGSFSSTECAVCMDQQCEVIFVPCGHLCCCIKCAESMSQCPMCRSDIDQKIRVILP